MFFNMLLMSKFPSEKLKSSPEETKKSPSLAFKEMLNSMLFDIMTMNSTFNIFTLNPIRQTEDLRQVTSESKFTKKLFLQKSFIKLIRQMKKIGKKFLKEANPQKVFEAKMMIKKFYCPIDMQYPLHLN